MPLSIIIIVTQTLLEFLSLRDCAVVNYVVLSQAGMRPRFDICAGCRVPIPKHVTETHSSHYWTANERRQHYVRVEAEIDLHYARLEVEKDGARRSGPLLNHHLMRQHCLLLEQRFVLENRFRARHYNAYLESSMKERVSRDKHLIAF